MNNIIITGDIHADPCSRFSVNAFPQGKKLDKGDYVIILGDFGLVWENEETKNEKYLLDWLNHKPWTTLFIDGNHENFERLNTYPIEEWHGGKVHVIRSNILHLMRGEIFNICGKQFLAMGGANSHDIQHGIIDPANYKTKEEMKAACKALENKCGGWNFAMYRIKGINWWAQEVPSIEEQDNAIKNLAEAGYKVDYILSHEAPASAVPFVSIFKSTEYSKWLENEIRANTIYKKWFFGHYHLDLLLPSGDNCLYNSYFNIYGD